MLFCAKQLPPPGGPIDTTPPNVVKIVPNPGALNVLTHTKIEITFSEGMNHKTVDDAIFISPWPSEEIKFHWKRKKLRIVFGDTLKENRTYVLTIGAKSTDLHNNQMKESFSMAFSTGDHIDEGQVSGRVYSGSGVEGTLVCAYLLLDSTDVDPAKVLADYYTQCGQQGNYQLKYVAPGKYRLFAIRDRDGNRKYTRGIDALGVPTNDINITKNEEIIQNINFQLTLVDTIPPALKSVYAINRSNLLVRFSEEVANFDEANPRKYFEIFAEKEPSNGLQIIECYRNLLDPSNIFIMTKNQSAINYELIVQNIKDNSGNPVDTSSNMIVFAGSTDPDTARPLIVFKSIQDSSKGIVLNPVIRLVFSEAMDQRSVEKNFLFRTNDSLLVHGQLSWKDPADISFQLDSLLKSLTWYVIQLGIDSIRDQFGNVLRDSVNAIYFRTLNSDTLSALGGDVSDEQEVAKGKIYLTAKSGQNSYELILNKPGTFNFENILPGIYTIYGFRDTDSNGVYSYGSAIPFVPAERFVFFPDSIKIRSRWPNEGNDIIFK